MKMYQVGLLMKIHTRNEMVYHGGTYWTLPGGMKLPLGSLNGPGRFALVPPGMRPDPGPVSPGPGPVSPGPGPVSPGPGPVSPWPPPPSLPLLFGAGTHTGMRTHCQIRGIAVLSRNPAYGCLHLILRTHCNICNASQSVLQWRFGLACMPCWSAGGSILPLPLGYLLGPARCMAQQKWFKIRKSNVKAPEVIRIRFHCDTLRLKSSISLCALRFWK